MRSVATTLRIGDRLDRRFALLRGEMERSKQSSITELARVFAIEGVAYAVIGGVAVQLWSAEPRTTLDVDVAVLSCEALPRAALVAAGFKRGRRFAHSENWTGPDGTPVQFTDDAALADAVRNAEVRPFGKLSLRIAPVVELVRSKLRAAADPRRRRSKRLMDFADAVALCESHRDVVKRLTDDERRRLDA